MGWSRRAFIAQLSGMLVWPGGMVAGANDRTPVQWHTDYLHAQRLRAAHKRPMLIYLTMDGCPHCHQMMHTTYEEGGVAQELSSRFVLTIINASQQKLLAEQFGARVYPTTYLVAPDNRMLDRIEGFVPPQKLRERVASTSARIQAHRTHSTSR